VTRLFYVFLVGCILSGCSSSNSSEESLTLLEQLINTTWASSLCESHMGYPYTKHSFTLSTTEITFDYVHYGPECIEQLGEFTEIRPFQLGGQLTTESGANATEIDILTIVLQPGDIEHNIKDLLYVSADNLFFGLTGREMECEPENLRVDVVGGGFLIDAYVCDQRPTKIDFEHVYTKKI